MMMMMKKIFSMLIFFLCFVSALLLQPCLSTTILVDGVSVWKNPSVRVGDSIIFKHQNHYNLYIFQNKNAFSLCNFTQATLLTKPNSTSYTWHPSRPGFFYFSFNNGSLNTCQNSLKLSIEVISPAPITPSKDLPPTATPAPISGGVVSSAPSYPWPFRPRQGAFSPVPAPTENSPVTVPTLVPDKGAGDGGNGGGSTAIPFINSNPAVPLPTGEVDSATIRPLPTSGQASQVVVVGLVAGQTALFSIILLVL
ncbi:uncharacterized protein LOC110818801 [Carica papaya]|uniref:uncharacterized protein LOC110818801 n=1 Tax=Carica papaya TaxID=3649 RepID=UPI000B8D16A7|nr:uncharacterized protein LOC110818801 [Carica papaya]